MTKPATIEIDRDRAYDWLMKGAQPTDTVRAILRFKGVFYKKHLMRGVKKGAMTPEEAEAKYQEWVDAKEAKIAERFAKAAEEQAAFHAHVSGTETEPEPVAVAVEAAPEVAEEPAEAPAEPAEETVAEETPAETAEAAEETPAAEAEAEAATEEAEETAAEEATAEESEEEKDA